MLPGDDFHLGLCFCPHCLTAARAAGIDAEVAHSTAADLLGHAAFAHLPDLKACLLRRNTPVTTLLEEIRAAVPRHIQRPLIAVAGTWASGGDLPALSAPSSAPTRHRWRGSSCASASCPPARPDWVRTATMGAYPELTQG